MRCWLLPLVLVGIGCGAAAPSEETIFYDPALRPGVVEPSTESERALLARMGELAPGEQVVLDEQPFVAGPPYFAASGRQCRALSGGGRTRLACEDGEGAWVFVPEVLAPAEVAE